MTCTGLRSLTETSIDRIQFFGLRLENVPVVVRLDERGPFGRQRGP